MKRKRVMHHQPRSAKSSELGRRRTPVAVETNYRISGHESFACRYTWLPKAVHGIQRNPKLFANEASAMVDLGVGKNMVRSIRFWAQASGVIGAGKSSEFHLTDMGLSLLGENGLDPFLEDIPTLWLVHWNLATGIENPLLAWDYLLNRWHQPELVPSVVLRVLDKETMKKSEGVSPVTPRILHLSPDEESASEGHPRPSVAAARIQIDL